jgi:hypothetical protein
VQFDRNQFQKLHVKSRLDAFGPKLKNEMAKKTKALIAEEAIVSKIIRVRGERVMLDCDLAEMYGVETRVLNQAVSRNIGRFPEDFMFELNRDEILRISQIVTSYSHEMVSQIYLACNIFSIFSNGVN